MHNVSQTGSPVLCIKMSDDLQMYAAVDKSKKNRNRKEENPPHTTSSHVRVQTKDEYAVVDKSKKLNKKVLLMRGQDSSFPQQTRNYKDDDTMSSGGTSGVKRWSDTVHSAAVPLQTKIPSSNMTPHKISLMRNVDYKSPYVIACFIVATVSIVAGMTIVISAFTLIANLQSQLLSTKRLVDKLSAENRAICNSTTRISVQIVAGFYELRNSNESFALLHCSPAIENKQDGLRNVADLNVNVTGTNTQCPPGFELIRNPFSCRTVMNGSGCTSVNYSVSGLSYSYVTGKIIACQFLNPDAFAPSDWEIDSSYVDGVSLTYGNPRKHIWTFAAGIVGNDNLSCPRCNYFKPRFIGNNFSCEINDVCDSNAPYCHDPLWDGNQCFGSATFYRELPEPTSEDIEMRVCRDQDNNDEDILLTLVDLYVL